MKSVSSRLLAIVLAIVIAGMGLITVIGTTLSGNAFSRQALGWVAEATSSETERMDAWLIQQIGYIEAIAADFSSIKDISPEALLPSLVRHAEMNDEFYSVYVGFTDGSAVFNDEWVPDSDWIATDRDWYRGAASSPESVYITELYVDAETGNLCITLSKVITHNGNMAGVVAIDIFTTVLSDIVSESSVGEDSYAFLTDGQGNIIAHQNSGYNPVIDSNEDVVYQNIARIHNGVYADLLSPGVVGGNSLKLQDVNGVSFYYTACEIPTNGWILYTAIPVNVVNAPIIQQIKISAIVFIVVLGAAVFFIYFSLRRLITRPVKDVTKAANLLASGEIGVSLNGNYKGEIALLADSFRGMEKFNRQQTEWLEYIANGDLSIEVIPRGENDRIGYAIDSMLKRLREMFIDISESTNQVSSSSMQIAHGAQALAQSSTEQSASIQELSSSIAEIAEKTKENASKAEKAARLAETIRSSANKG
ncbi:MAG: methyl-accepting chemotaxis protein, partial [Clostridiales bacterium]|nr:methyl-accepting chemotaxis protein [Clostridiales bacterium]